MVSLADWLKCGEERSGVSAGHLGLLGGAQEVCSFCIRQAGCVIHIGRFESGLCSVAAPVFDMSGAIVAAISATKVADSVPKDVENSVLQTSRAISRGLGWKEQEQIVQGVRP